MFEFKSKQQTFNIGGIKVGGVPGQNPTVLIGTIFYHGHKAVIDGRRNQSPRRIFG